MTFCASTFKSRNHAVLYSGYLTSEWHPPAVLQSTHTSICFYLRNSQISDSFFAWNDDHFCICEDCKVWVEWRSIGQTDESFVFSLIDADILSCLLLLHFAEFYPSYWHAPSPCYIVTHWCMHSPSLCISPLLCLVWFPLVPFLLCTSLAATPHCSPRSCRCYRPVIHSAPSLTFSPFNLILHTSSTPSPRWPPCISLPLSITRPFLPPFLHILLFIPVFSLCISASTPPPPTTCLCSTRQPVVMLAARWSQHWELL